MENKKGRKIDWKNRQLTTTEFAYLAGLLEGEGYFGFDKRGLISQPYLVLAMTDKDVVEYAATLIEGNMILLKRRTRKSKPVYRVSITRRERILYLYTGLLPFLGKRRSEQVNESLILIKQHQTWVAEGGRSQQARNANRARFQKP